MLGKKTAETKDAQTPIRSGQGQSEPAGASLIARGTTVSGDCITTGSLRVEGHVTGRVEAVTLEVAGGGRVDGDAICPKAMDGSEVFVIHGLVEGNVKAPRVEVGKEGSVLGGIEGREAVVHGKVHGGIVAQHRLILEETSLVEGDVRARRLALKEGGQVNGDIRMGDRASE